MNTRKHLAPLLSALAGASLLIYLWIVLGDRGLNADATQTAGYTHPYEYIMGIIGFGLLCFSVYSLVKGSAKGEK